MLSAMILGLGLDLVSIPRFERFVARRGERGLRRVFTPGELEYCRSLPAPAPSFAARFAAKEAFLKALGTGLAGHCWTDVEVVRAESGEPSLQLHGAAAETVRRRGVTAWHLSLTHTADLAGAVVVLER